MKALAVGFVLAGLLAAMMVSGLRAVDHASASPVSPDEIGIAGGPCYQIVSGPNPAMADYIAKGEVVRAVIRREMGLIEAARRFQELSASDPGCLDRLRRVFQVTPSASDEEIFARNVIRRVLANLLIDGASTELVDQLEAELSDYLSLAPLPENPG
jgi:hypothetical protein